MKRQTFFAVLTCAWIVVILVMVNVLRKPVTAYYAEQAYLRHSEQGSHEYVAGAYADAANDYTAMIALRPESMDGYRLRGRANFSLGNYSAAESDAGAALARLPATAHGRGESPDEIASDGAMLYGDRGRARLGMGIYDQAISDLTRCLQHDPHDDEARAARMQAYLLSGQSDRAIADAGLLISARSPAAGAAYTLRGRVDARRGHFARAASDLGMACQIEPGDPDHWFDAAWYTLRSGNASGAIAIYQEALIRDPERASGWFRLCMAQAANNDVAAAMDTCGRGLHVATPADRAAARHDVSDVASDYPGESETFERVAGWLQEIPT
jgi:tetratricopeptide (TPR) repeat protein